MPEMLFVMAVTGWPSDNKFDYNFTVDECIFI